MSKHDSQLPEENEGPVLVFLHYFGGAAPSWQWVVEQLATDYRCVALNLPGFGETDPLGTPSVENFANYLREEVEQQGLESVTLVGHSMSAKIAVQAAANDTDGHIKRLILIAPSPPTVERMPSEEKERMLRHPDRSEAETTVNNATQRALSPERYERAVATQLQIDPATWQWWLRVGMDHSIADQVTRINVPITVLASDDDPVIDAKTIRDEVMAVLPEATLVRATGVGHLLPLEDPDWVAAQIRRAVPS